MRDLAVIAVIVLLALPAFAIAFRNYSLLEKKLLWLGAALHAITPWATLWTFRVFYKGIGDTLSYFQFGDQAARFVSLDFDSHGRELLKLIFHGDARLPVPLEGIGTSTGTMNGLAAVLVLLFGSAWPGTVAASILSYSGQVAGFAAMRPAFEKRLHPRLLVGMLLVPSVVFWTSSFQKEMVAMAAMGWLLLAWRRLLERRWLSGLVTGTLSAVGLALIKAYVLVPFAFSAGLWLYWDRSRKRTSLRIRPLWLVIAAVVVVVSIVGLGALFPQYALERIAEEAPQRRYYASFERGGSYIELGETQDRSFRGLLTVAPLGLLAVLFRPSVFDVRNIAMGVNAIETTLITVILIALAVRWGPGAVFRKVLASPPLVFCATFTLMLALGVGLTTSNLGTMSRYRAPLMPFYATLVLVLSAPRREGARAGTLRSVRPARADASAG